VAIVAESWALCTITFASSSVTSASATRRGVRPGNMSQIGARSAYLALRDFDPANVSCGSIAEIFRFAVRVRSILKSRHPRAFPACPLWLPTITLKASVLGSAQPKTLVDQIAPKVDEFARQLPAGYAVATGGAVEESAKSQAPIEAVVPLMLFIMATILMIQLQSFHRLFLVFAVAPLALIGVVMALLPSGAPLGFVAILGVLALIGILIRNSVILIAQIEQLKEEGRPVWDAVVEATEHRMRPIMLTAAAASLALIPIAREIFWGPMAYAMMGGIIVGTMLTLLFLPALYVAWFRIDEPASVSTGPDAASTSAQESSRMSEAAPLPAH
jgi:hypothetical protein